MQRTLRGVEGSPSLENHQRPTDKESSQHKRSDTAHHQPEKAQIAETKTATNEKPESAPNSANGEQTYKVEIKEGKPDWWSRSGMIVNGILAVAAFFTLLMVKHQRDVMRQQVKAMQDQIAEMQVAREQTIAQMTSAGEQTDELIINAMNQVNALNTLADATEESAEAAKKSADAALLNAQAIVKAERAWFRARQVLVTSGASA